MKEYRYYILKYSLFLIVFFAMLSCNKKDPFKGYLYPIRENGLYGYIDSVGNRIIKPEFLWLSIFHNGLAMAVVDTIYREVPDSMAYEVGESDTIINVYRMYVKYGYINKTGEFVIEPRLISYVIMPETGFVAKNMDECANALYRHIFLNRRALFYDTLSWKNGYIDTKGNVAINAKYYYSEPFSEGLAVVRDNVAEPIITNRACITPSRLRCAYIDTLGNSVTQFKYETLTRFTSGRGIGTFKSIHNDSTQIGDTLVHYETFSEPRFLINENGEEIKELDYFRNYYGFSKDGICVALDNFILSIRNERRYSYIDTDGDYLEPLMGLAQVDIDALNYREDILQVLPENASIPNTTSFKEGFAGISPDGNHWFVIDKHLLIHGYGEESVFEGFKAFNNGLAAVKRNGKWGFIDKTIKEIIPCKYDSCGGAYPQLEEVFEYDIQGEVKKKAYINRKDSLIWESPLYKSEKIENRYSIKDRKDYGKWIYEYNPFNKHLIYLIIGGILVLLIAICVIWNSVSNKSSKGKNNKELIIQNEPEKAVAADAILTNVNDEDIDEILAYPTVGQYTEVIKESVKAPDEYFDKLKHLRPVLDGNGEPIMSSGNFAVVFKMKDEYGKLYAVRCFHRAHQGREKNYKLICEELAKFSSPYLSPIRYYDKELFVESSEYPVLLMDWVDGMTLDKYIRKVINDKKALIQLAANFRKLAIWLLAQPFAHGDLKPDNILVKNDGSFVLVDYDGMFVPAMQGQKAREIGSPDFRNPSRTEDDFNKDIDVFPIISIMLSLELLVVNHDYLFQYGADDRLLFSRNDYLDLGNSKIYMIAFASLYAKVSDLAILMNKMIQETFIDNNLFLSILEKEYDKPHKDPNSRINIFSSISICVILPIFLFILPLHLRSYFNMNIILISIIIMTIIFVAYLFALILDIFRPDKSKHLDVLHDDVNGCLGYVAIVPILLMGDFFADWVNSFNIPFFSSIPYYKDEWYVTCFIWLIGFILLKIAFSEHNYLLDLRLKIYQSDKEKEFSKINSEKERIRKELKKEKTLYEHNRLNRKVFECDELPF